MLLFYIRHGDPIYSPDSLTPQGSCQAAALAKRLALFGLDAIYASTSNRAMLTAQPTCDILNLPMTTMDWCNENYAWMELSYVHPDGRRQWIWQTDCLAEAMSSSEMRKLDRRWYEHPALAQYNYGPGIRRIQTAADAWLAQLGYEHDLNKNMYYCREKNQRRIALFAHQGFGLAFLSCVLDVPYPQMSTRFDMGHSGMTVIHFAEQPSWCAPRALQISNDSHLYREGLPTNYQNEIRF